MDGVGPGQAHPANDEKEGAQHGKDRQVYRGQGRQFAFRQGGEAAAKKDDAQQRCQTADDCRSADAGHIDVAMAQAQRVADVHEPAAAGEPVASDGKDQGGDQQPAEGSHPARHSLAKRQQGQDGCHRHRRQIGQVEA